MTIDFDDLFDFEEKLNENEAFHLYQQQQMGASFPGTSSVFSTDSQRPSSTSSEGHVSASRLPSTADGFTGKPATTVYSSSLESGYFIHNQSVPVGIGFTGSTVGNPVQYSAPGKPSASGAQFPEHASMFFLSHDFSSLEGGNHPLDAANTIVGSHPTTSFLTNREREAGAGMANDRSAPSAGSAATTSFTSADAMASGLGDDATGYQQLSFHRASVSSTPDPTALYMTHPGAPVGAAVDRYGNDATASLLNATEYQLNEDIKNASATLSVLHQHSQTHQTATTHAMTHQSMPMSMAHSIHGQQLMQPPQYYAQGMHPQYASGAAGHVYGIGPEGIPMEQLVSSQPTAYHPLLSNHVVLSPIPNHSIASTGSIPISNSAYGLPGPHSLIAVAHSPANISGSPLSTSYGNSVATGGQLTYIPQTSLSTIPGSSANRARKKPEELVSYPAGTDKLYIKRERNRLAAERCRRKKLELIDALQAENERLKHEVDKLRMELVQIQQIQQGQV